MEYIVPVQSKMSTMNTLAMPKIPNSRVLLTIEEGDESYCELTTMSSDIPVLNREYSLNRVEGDDFLEEVETGVTKFVVREVSHITDSWPGGDADEKNTGDDGSLTLNIIRKTVMTPPRKIPIQRVGLLIFAPDGQTPSTNADSTHPASSRGVEEAPVTRPIPALYVRPIRVK